MWITCIWIVLLNCSFPAWSLLDWKKNVQLDAVLVFYAFGCCCCCDKQLTPFYWQVMWRLIFNCQAKSWSIYGSISGVSINFEVPNILSSDSVLLFHKVRITHNPVSWLLSRLLLCNLLITIPLKRISMRKQLPSINRPELPIPMI